MSEQDFEHNDEAKIAEEAWSFGSKAAYREMLSHCLRQIGHKEAGPEIELGRVVAQLEEIRVVLRRVCKDNGIPFDEELHLADVIDKYVAPRLRPSRRRA